MTANSSQQPQDVILLHSAGTDGRLWWKVSEQLGPEVTVHTPDLINAEIPDSQNPTFTEINNYLADWASHQKIERFVLAGISMGGMIAQYFAAQFPKRVTGLVIGNTNYMQNANQRSAMLARAQYALESPNEYIDDTSARWFDAEFRESNPADVAQVEKILHSVSPMAHSTAWKLISTLDTQPILENIVSSTFVIGGTNDRSTPLTVQEHIRDQIAAAHLLVAEADHMSCVESPEVWSAAIYKLLDPTSPVHHSSQKRKK